MFNSVALDVVLGLIFIYLLYSLLATVLSEMIASLLGLRARNLKEAINRMLNDDQVRTWTRRLMDSLKIMKNPDNKVINSFYENPEIKYLGGTGIFTKPSFIKPGSFSRALIDELAGNRPATADKITATLRQSASNPANAGPGEKKRGFLDHESGSYLLKLWEDAGADIDKFRLLLEDWFDRTMDQASEWYKRKIQAVLLVLGFCMAWFFFADTFIMVKTLSNDRNAREQMVSLASAKAQARPDKYDPSIPETWKKLDADITNANSVLGLGGWLPRRGVMVMTHPVTREKSFVPRVDENSLSLKHRKVINGPIEFSFSDKLAYLFRLAINHFFGFMITAVAISLGAPFWFDLLNKVMKLRTSGRDKPRKG